MSQRFIITLTAANRVGILAAVSNALAELGGDLWQISQTVVEKFFTMIIAADFPEARTAEVVLDHIRDVCRPYAVDVTLKTPTQERFPEAPEEGTLRYFLTLSGENQPGVIRLVSGRLAHDQIDIVNLEATRTDEGRAFLFHLELAIPPRTSLEQLKTDLGELGPPGAFQVQLRSNGEVAESRPLRAFLR